MAYSNPYVAIIDVGHGNSTVLRCELSAIVIDCGSRGTALLEFLKNEGINNIDTVFLSHADQDHIGGLMTLLASKAFQIKNVFVNSDASKGSKLWDDLSYELSQLSVQGGINFSVGITRGVPNLSCGSIGLEVVGPTPYLATKGAGGVDRVGREISSNSISASFIVSWNSKPIVYLPGDLDSIGLEDLVGHGISFVSPVLVFPHHGGKTGSSDIVGFTNQLCDLVLPETVIFSIGRNKHENPRPEVIGAIRSKVKNVRVACTQLSKHCANTLPSISPSHLNAFFASGRAANECCSGTFVIEFSHTVQHFPDPSSHRAFIAKSAPTSLCG